MPEDLQQESRVDGGVDVWDRHLRTWELVGPPLRPGEQDRERFDAAVVGWSQQHGAPRALVLGATPELARLRWPVRTHLIAVDHNDAMIQRMWPGYPGPLQGGVKGDWLQLPLKNGSRDLVLGDGVFNLMDFPAGHRKLLRAIRRVLSDQGLCVIRCFTKPEKSETPRQVLEDLWGGRIGNFHVFKWRLAMALHGRVEQGVRLKDIWDYWSKSVDPHELAERLSWQAEVIATIDNYRGLEERYAFATLREIKSLTREAFVEVQCQFPTYELGERCPILTLRPRQGKGAPSRQEDRSCG
jgi:SAM-dependent methyltransferase